MTCCDDRPLQAAQVQQQLGGYEMKRSLSGGDVVKCKSAIMRGESYVGTDSNTCHHSSPDININTCQSELNQNLKLCR